MIDILCAFVCFYRLVVWFVKHLYTHVVMFMLLQYPITYILKTPEYIEWMRNSKFFVYPAGIQLSILLGTYVAVFIVRPIAKLTDCDDDKFAIILTAFLVSAAYLVTLCTVVYI